MYSLQNNTTNAVNTTSLPTPSASPNVLLALAWAVIIPIALLGNGFVLRTVFTVPEMKTSTNVLFVNMAVSDIITALTLIPMMMALHILNSREWFGGTFGMVTCKLMLYAGYTTISASIFALTLMAIDRFFAICCPLKRVSLFKRYKLITMLVWLPSLVLSLPVAIVAYVKPIGNKNYCELKWNLGSSDIDFQMLFLIFFFVAEYVLPLVVMAVLYGKISKSLWFTKIPSEKIPKDESQRKRAHKKRKIVVMLMVVLAVFAVCWFPVQLTHLLIVAHIDRNSPAFFWFSVFSFWFAHANSAINPCLYISLHSGFKKAFYQCFSRRGKKRLNQDEQSDILTRFQTKRTTIMTSKL